MKSSAYFSSSMTNNHSIHAVKLFIFVLFQDHIWEIIVVQFPAAAMPMQTVYLHSEVLSHSYQTKHVPLVHLGPAPVPTPAPYGRINTLLNEVIN